MILNEICLISLNITPTDRPRRLNQVIDRKPVQPLFNLKQ